MRRVIAIAVSVAGLGLAVFAGAPTQADEYGARMPRHHVRYVARARYAGCEQVVVTGYRYYPRVQLYSRELVEYTRVVCG